MSSKQTLNDLVDALASGAIEIVDLSGPLGPKTPLIKIPPEYGPDTPPIEIHSARSILVVELAQTRRTFRHTF